MTAVSEDIAAQRPPSYGTHDSTETLPTYEAKPYGGHPDQEEEKENTEEATKTPLNPCLDASEVESLVGLDDETIREAELQGDFIRKRGSQWFLILKVAFLVLVVALILIFSVADNTYRLRKDQDSPNLISNLFWIGYSLPMGIFTIINVIESNIRR